MLYCAFFQTNPFQIESELLYHFIIDIEKAGYFACFFCFSNISFPLALLSANMPAIISIVLRERKYR